MGRSEVRVGTAGWTIPAAVRDHFPADGSQLERYATHFTCAEINSTFYRPHRPSTYARWAASVPAGFRFALKLPKTIIHERRLVDAAAPLDRFLDESSALGEKRAVLLVQLPPSFAWDAAVVETFFTLLRERYRGPVACEPRHASWFEPAVDDALQRFEVARVAADPPIVPAAAQPGGWDGFRYYRLHGKPHTYYSAYEADEVGEIAALLRAEPRAVWCIFDNTASGAAFGNALALTELLTGPRT